MKWYSLADGSADAIEAVAEELVATWLCTETERDRFTQVRQWMARAGNVEDTDEVESLLSEHAMLRLRQRGLSMADVDYILNNGVCEQMAAATIYYLRAVDIPGDERATHQRLVGTAVITAPDGDRIITIWRNRKHGLRNLRQKRHQRWRFPTVLANKTA